MGGTMPFHTIMKIQKIVLTAIAALGLITFNTSCGPGAKRGAVIGGLAGAGAGAIIGHQSGRGLEGAAIGGAVGAGSGALIGGARDDEREIQRNHQNYENRGGRY